MARQESEGELDGSFHLAQQEGFVRVDYVTSDDHED